jgi:hypothetical protein
MMLSAKLTSMGYSIRPLRAEDRERLSWIFGKPARDHRLSHARPRPGGARPRSRRTLSSVKTTDSSSDDAGEEPPAPSPAALAIVDALAEVLARSLAAGTFDPRRSGGS